MTTRKIPGRRPQGRRLSVVDAKAVATPSPPRHGLARVLSKHGLCSRTEAANWIQAGRVQVDGRVIRDPECPVVAGRHVVKVDGQRLDAPRHHYLMLNKPRGLVTSTRDEQGRDTVYSCLQGTGLPWLAPVGRLDKASEGLLLFSNDPVWAAGITGAEHGLVKTYHVQIDVVPDADMLERLRDGVSVGGELLRAVSVALLRSGQRNSWIEVVLDEGRNRHIRRLLEAFEICVLRLVRVAIGTLQLGEVPKGQWRVLEAAEVSALVDPASAPASAPGAWPATD